MVSRYFSTATAMQTTRAVPANWMKSLTTGPSDPKASPAADGPASAPMNAQVKTVAPL
jgi:hypothetical protein